MKMGGRRLKRILQENPLPVKPEKKEEMLLYAWMKEEAYNTMEDGFHMKYMNKHKFRTLIVAMLILMSLACAISAGITQYYYHTPGGNIIDQGRNFVKEPSGLTLKMTETKIRGDGYTITEVNWTSVDGRETFTVWASADSIELKGLCAEIGDTEYPLKKTFVTKDKNGNPLNYGYTSLDVPEPESFELREEGHYGLKLTIDEPEAWHYIFFVPEDSEPVSDTWNDITLTGCYYDDKLYYGFADHNLTGAADDLILSSHASPSNACIVGTDGKTYVNHENYGKHTYGIGEGSGFSSYDTLSGIVPKKLSVESLHAVYDLRWEKGKTYGELPIPERGETLKGNWVIFDYAGLRIVITEITHTYERGRSTLRLYGSDLNILLNQRYIPESSLFYGNVTSGNFMYILEPDCDWGIIRKNDPERRELILSSKSIDEYCENHTTFCFGVGSLYVTYSGNWTLTFPEN